MISYFQSLTTAEKAITILGATLGAAFIYGMVWAFAIGCVAIGYGPEVCGV